MERERKQQAEPNVPLDGDRSVAPLEEALAAVGGTIAAVGRQLASHPGFMWTSAGFEVLHANWPAYPWGHGISAALSSLTEYPRGTRFFPIDNIDQCTLFGVGEKPKDDPCGPQHLHVAVWDDDLRACASARYIDGVRDNEEFLHFPHGCMELTTKGANRVIIDMLLGPAPKVLEEDVLDALHEGRYDAAVREASLRVEVALRQASGLPDHGRRLVEKCFGTAGVLVPSGLTNASRQILRNVFHGYFKYVRNEFAHSLPPVDMLTACTLLRRSAELLTVVEAADRERKHDG